MTNTLSIGQKLSAARNALNKKRSTVAEDLNIRESYIEAIESDNYDIIPGKAYVSGFVKSYADYLNLESEDLLKMLKATQNLQEDYKNMPQQLYKDYKRTKNIFVLSFFMLLLVFAGYNYFSYISHQIDIRKIKQKASSSETLNSFFDQTQHEYVATEQVIEATTTNTQQEPSLKDLIKDNKIELYGQKSKPPFARVLFKANKDVWIQVRPLHKNRIYVSKTIPAGKYYWLSPWENVVLDVSNPNDLDIIIDGENMGNLGSNSKRIRGLFLDVPSLKSYYEKEEFLNNDTIENYYEEANTSDKPKILNDV